MTPHNGATTKATRTRGYRIFADNLRRYVAGDPLVNHRRQIYRLLMPFTSAAEVPEAWAATCWFSRISRKASLYRAPAKLSGSRQHCLFRIRLPVGHRPLEGFER